MHMITVLSSGRADYSILKPVISCIETSSKFKVRVAAFGMHLLPENKAGLSAILQDGYAVDVVQAPPLEDTPRGIANAMSITTHAFAEYLESIPTDVLLCVGDRYEMLAAVIASVPFDVPVIHLHGGEKTLGAMDDVFRHAITAISSFHFTAHEKYSDRVREIVGNDRHNTVFTVGAPGIDTILQTEKLTSQEFKCKFGVDLSIPTILATYHPETRRGEAAIEDAIVFATALRNRREQIILTMPNSDTFGKRVGEVLKKILSERPNTYFFDMLGLQGYYSAMAMCCLVVGNSSSGIIEAASFKKPVVNVGERQRGRLKGANVIDCPTSVNSINQAIDKAYLVDKQDIVNIFGQGDASPKIVSILEQKFGK